MATPAFFLPYNPVFNTNGLPVAGAKVYFYTPGTSTKAPVYADATRETELPNPVTSNSAARLPAIYFDDDTDYRVVIRDPLGEILEEIDPFTPGTYPQGERGDPGPQGYSAATLAQLKAAPTTDGPLNYDQAVFDFLAGDYTGQADDVNIIKSDHAPLSDGAWIRQSAAKIVFAQPSPSAIIRPASEKIHEIEISITDFGAVADGVTDNTAAIEMAMTAAALIGGAVVIPAADQPFGWSGAIQVPNGVALRGHCHNGLNNEGAGLIALSDDAQIRFGGQGSANAHFSGYCGDFYVDGGAVATAPLYFGRGSDKFVGNITVRNTAAGDTAIRVEEGQNFVFSNVRTIDGVRGKGWVFDRGTGGHILLGCNANDTGDFGIYITETWGGGLDDGVYAAPSHINFYSAIVERDTTGKALYVGACSDIIFHQPIFASNSRSAPVNLVTIALEPDRSVSRLVFQDAQVFGSQDYTTAFSIGNGADVIFGGRAKLNSLLVGFNITAGATVDLKDYASSGVTSDFAGTGAADTYARFRLMQPINFTRTAASDTVLAMMNGLAGQYARMRLDGRLDWGSGTGFSFDTNLYRSAADRLQTDDHFTALKGIGLPAYTVATLPAANSVPARTIVYVSDGSAGSACIAMSNGSATWNVVATVGAAVSAS